MVISNAVDVKAVGRKHLVKFAYPLSFEFRTVVTCVQDSGVAQQSGNGFTTVVITSYQPWDPCFCSARGMTTRAFCKCVRGEQNYKFLSRSTVPANQILRTYVSG